MKKTDVKIPVAIQLVLDDIGWFWGRDERDQGHPSRTGLPRWHVVEDYMMVDAVGRAINQKINTMFVIGEWDRNNVLRKVPYSNKFGKDWDSSKWLNLEEAEKIRDFMNSCEYIELGYHGLLHGLWEENGTHITETEFFAPEDFKKGSKPFKLLPESMLRQHFDAFLEIYNDWGFNHKLRTFASPCGNMGAEKTDEFTKVLKDYGVKFWHNNGIKNCIVQTGIICNAKAIEIVPWESYDIDPEILPTYDPEKAGILGGHWPNLLRYNPKKNFERVEAWKSFFDRQSEVFGMIISRDMEFAHYQQLHKFYGEVEEENGMIKIDLTKVDDMAPEKNKDFYISIKNGNEPTECIGGKITLYETKKDFKNYKIERTEGSVIYIK